MKRFLWPTISTIALLAGFVWGASMLRFKVWPHALVRDVLQYEANVTTIRKARFAANTSPAEVVFVGDSIFRLFELGEDFPGIDARNRAIDGNTSADVLQRIEPIAAINAETYVVMIGTNDVSQGVPAEETAANIKRILAALPGRNLLLAVPPCKPNFLTCDQSRIDRVNALISETPGFVSYSLDPVRQMQDKVHPNASGLETIASVIRDRL